MSKKENSLKVVVPRNGNEPKRTHLTKDGVDYVEELGIVYKVKENGVWEEHENQQIISEEMTQSFLYGLMKNSGLDDALISSILNDDENKNEKEITSSNTYAINELIWTQRFSEEGVLSIYADIDVVNIKTSEPTIAGMIHLHVFDGFWNPDLIDAADSISGDAELLIGELMDVPEEELEEFSRVAIIDQIYLEENYRGHGLGKDIFKKVNHYLNSIMRADVIALTAQPLDKNEEGIMKRIEDDKKIQELTEWYKSFGYNEMSKGGNRLYINARLKNPLLDWE